MRTERLLVCATCGRDWSTSGRLLRQCPDCRRRRNAARLSAPYARRPKPVAGHVKWVVLGPLPCRTCSGTVYYGEAPDDTTRLVRDLDGWTHRCGGVL